MAICKILINFKTDKKNLQNTGKLRYTTAIFSLPCSTVDMDKNSHLLKTACRSIVRIILVF